MSDNVSVREQLKDLTKQYDKSENDLKALQSVGQIVGEVLKQLTEEKCKYFKLFFLFFYIRFYFYPTKIMLQQTMYVWMFVLVKQVNNYFTSDFN